MMRTDLIGLIRRAMEHGLQFTSSEPETVADRMTQDGEMTQDGGIGDLRRLAAYVLRVDSHHIQELIGVYAGMLRRPAGSPALVSFRPEVGERDLEAMFYIDVSDLLDVAREKMKRFYYLHAGAPRACELCVGGLVNLGYCHSQAHLQAIAGMLDGANTDVRGFRARLLRVLLANAADLQSYNYTLRETGAVHDWKDKPRAVVLVDDPALLTANGEMAPLLRERMATNVKVAVSLPDIFEPGAMLPTGLGELEIVSEYSIAAPGDAGFPNGTSPYGLAGEAEATAGPLGTSESPDAVDPLFGGGSALTNVLPLVRR